MRGGGGQNRRNDGGFVNTNFTRSRSSAGVHFDIQL
jgi:hypothetical protein